MRDNTFTLAASIVRLMSPGAMLGRIEDILFLYESWSKEDTVTERVAAKLRVFWMA